MPDHVALDDNAKSDSLGISLDTGRYIFLKYEHMGKGRLFILLGVIVLILAFGMVGLRLNQIRDRLVFPYMAEKSISIPVERLKTIANGDNTDSSLITYYSPELNNKNAAILFPNEVLDLDKLAPIVSELQKTYALVVLPIYRGVVSIKTSWPTETLLYQDSARADDFVKSEGFTPTFIGGDGLGAAIAAKLASVESIPQLALYDPWKNTSDVFAKAPLLALLKLFRWDEFDTGALLAQTRAHQVTFTTSSPEHAAVIEALQKALPPNVPSTVLNK